MELSDAFKDLVEAERLLKERKTVKVYYADYLVSACYYHLAMVKSEGSHSMKDSRKLLWFTSRLIKNTQTVPSYQIEGYRLRGCAWWNIHKFQKAYSDFQKVLILAERTGARPELARTCFELGKCLGDPKSWRKIIRSKNGSEYLHKAKTMFEELDMKWDMEQYEKYIGI